MRKSLEALAESMEQVNTLKRSYEKAFVTTAPTPAPGAPAPQAYLQPQLYPQQLMLPTAMPMQAQLQSQLAAQGQQMMYPASQLMPAGGYQSGAVSTPALGLQSAPSAAVSGRAPTAQQTHQAMIQPIRAAAAPALEPYPSTAPSGMSLAQAAPSSVPTALLAPGVQQSQDHLTTYPGGVPAPTYYPR